MRDGRRVNLTFRKKFDTKSQAKTWAKDADINCYRVVKNGTGFDVYAKG